MHAFSFAAGRAGRVVAKDYDKEFYHNAHPYNFFRQQVDLVIDSIRDGVRKVSAYPKARFFVCRPGVQQNRTIFCVTLYHIAGPRNFFLYYTTVLSQMGSLFAEMIELIPHEPTHAHSGESFDYLDRLFTATPCWQGPFAKAVVRVMRAAQLVNGQKIRDHANGAVTLTPDSKTVRTASSPIPYWTVQPQLDSDIFDTPWQP